MFAAIAPAFKYWIVQILIFEHFFPSPLIRLASTRHVLVFLFRLNQLMHPIINLFRVNQLMHLIISLFRVNQLMHPIINLFRVNQLMHPNINLFRLIIHFGMPYPHTISLEKWCVFHSPFPSHKAELAIAIAN